MPGLLFQAAQRRRVQTVPRAIAARRITHPTACLRARYCLTCEEIMKIHHFSQESQSLAIRHNEKAIKLQQRGLIAEAVKYYQKAIKLWAAWPVPWYNLGLLRKEQRNWQESLRCNQKAVELDPSERDAWWNLGIAATALEDW